MNKLEQEVKKYAKERENESKTETITESIKGAFIKYNVEYTDTIKNYEYTSTNMETRKLRISRRWKNLKQCEINKYRCASKDVLPIR